MESACLPGVLSLPMNLEDLGLVGGKLTPCVIHVNRGEDVLEKISSVRPTSGSRGCILSAHGRLYSIMVRHASSSDTVHYEGSFEIISFSGSYTTTESNNGGSRNWCTRIQFAGHDYHVFGGEVAGPLMADNHIQVVLGFYSIKREKKSKRSSVPKPPKTTLESASRQGSGPAPDPHVSFEEGSHMIQSSTTLKQNLDGARSSSDTEDELTGTENKGKLH